jgi:glycosyltransferase involved in cell wall biosynthesis
VAGAGILVEPRDPHRLAVALAAAWSDEAVHSRLVAEAQARAAAAGRSWSDVARETRTVYAEVARPSIG